MRSIAFTTAMLVTCIGVASAQKPAALAAAMRAFHAAESPRDVAAAVRQVLASGASIEAIRAELQAGRVYVPRPAGRMVKTSRVNGIDLDNTIEIPDGYTPDRRWPLRVSLHGGVGREAPARGTAAARQLTNRIPGDAEIVIHPRAWSSLEWWKPLQVDNVLRLVDRVKREYNVDESRVYVTGISDGGTGVYFLGMREATMWAACLPLNGHPSVLANPDTGADGRLYAANLSNCPLHIVNGGKDPLYPAASVAPLVEMMTRGGVPIDFQVYPDAGHDVSWWPEERPRFAAFLSAHVRKAHPERVSWETERTDRYNRFRWLVIERLGARPSDVPLADVNTVGRSGGRTVSLYDRDRPSGRADARRQGNAFEIETRGVQQLTLLLSPDALDLTRAVRVTVNGRIVHDRIVTQDAATLLEWAARDRDRTMLYTAALRVAVP